MMRRTMRAGNLQRGRATDAHANHQPRPSSSKVQSAALDYSSFRGAMGEN